LFLVLAIFFHGWYVAWGRVEKQERARYVLRVDQVQVTPLPPWIHTDVRAEVFRSASRDPPLSLLDDDLTDWLKHAFKLHPWVARVNGVATRPGHVDVDLAYRQPVLMVEVAPDLFLPVDVEGMLLPNGDFSPNEMRSYACLAGIDTRPMGSIGQRWGDARVLDAAQIAAALGPAWQKIKLFRIQPAAAAGPAAVGEPTYEMFTQAGTRIVWGLAPGTKVLGEPSAAEKVARLGQYAAEHGGLDAPGTGQPLDVRAMPPARK
jgi:hypothetical protein